MKNLLPAATTLLSMPRKPLTIPLLLLVEFGFMLVGGVSHVWAAQASGQITGIMVEDRFWERSAYPNGQVGITVDPLPSSTGGCNPNTGLWIDTSQEVSKHIYAAALVAYTSGRRVQVYYDNALPPTGGCRVYGLVLEPN